MEKQRIKFFLVTVDQRIQLARTSEYQMIIVDVQYMLILRINPQLIV